MFCFFPRNTFVVGPQKYQYTSTIWSFISWVACQKWHACFGNMNCISYLLPVCVVQCRKCSSLLLSALILHQLSFPSAEWTSSLIDLLENRTNIPRSVPLMAFLSEAEPSLGWTWCAILLITSKFIVLWL